MFAIRDGERIRLISRSGVDWTCAFPMIVAAVEALAVRNCLIDGEVIMCGGDGLPDFQLLRRRQHTDPAKSQQCRERLPLCGGSQEVRAISNDFINEFHLSLVSSILSASIR
jgi:ATP-dependent DNA ligase